MREDLSLFGFSELLTAGQVDEAIHRDGTVLVVVNSVCGCAAANARPGAKMSLDNENTPDHLVTVFAGVDFEAVDAARAMMVPFPAELTVYGALQEWRFGPYAGASPHRRTQCRTHRWKPQERL